MNSFMLAYEGRHLFHFRQFTTLNLSCADICSADTRTAVTFLAKGGICQIF